MVVVHDLVQSEAGGIVSVPGTLPVVVNIIAGPVGSGPGGTVTTTVPPHPLVQRAVGGNVFVPGTGPVSVRVVTETGGTMSVAVQYVQPDGGLIMLEAGTLEVTVIVTGPGHIATVVLPPLELGGIIVIYGVGPGFVTVTQPWQAGGTPVMTVEAPPLVAGGTVVQKGEATVVVIVIQSVLGGPIPGGTEDPGAVSELGEIDSPKTLGTPEDQGYSV